MPIARRALMAIRNQPWAILPEWLPAIEAIAERAMDAPELLALREAGHAARYGEALAAMGQRLEGARLSTIRDGVAAIPVFGPIFPRANIMTEMSGATSLDLLAHDLRIAQASPAVHHILMVYDTPGGHVSGVAEFAGAIAASHKPATAFVSGLGCSAGYWLASPSKEIVADRSAMVGSIGVVCSVGWQEEPDQNGERWVDITSSHAPMKRLDYATEEGRAALRAEIDQIEDVFIDDVARGRKVSRATVISEFGKGGTMVGKAAKAAGMVDRLDSLDATLTRLAGRQRSGASRARAEADEDLRRRRASVL